MNLIRAGGNYGWPIQLGPGGQAGFTDPALVLPQVIVPTGCAFYAGTVDPLLPPRSDRPGNTIYFGDASGNPHRATLRPPDVTSAHGTGVVATFDGIVTDLQVSPDGHLYVATSESILRVGDRAGEPHDHHCARPRPFHHRRVRRHRRALPACGSPSRGRRGRAGRHAGPSPPETETLGPVQSFGRLR